MRNPIWMGFRVIDKKRDTSEKGRYPTKNGRQADRRKIARVPGRGNQGPRNSGAADFRNGLPCHSTHHGLKERSIGKAEPDSKHRFTYNGHMTCSRCEEPIQTAKARRDYYLCKGRVAHTCDTEYMAREKLESILDDLFSVSLTEHPSWSDALPSWFVALKAMSHEYASQRLTSEITNLQRKRDRIVDSFVDGVLFGKTEITGYS